MQVDPLNLKLKPPGTERLKLKYYKLLSTSAFNFNLRRYITEMSANKTLLKQLEDTLLKAGRCRLTLSNPS